MICATAGNCPEDGGWYSCPGITEDYCPYVKLAEPTTNTSEFEVQNVFTCNDQVWLGHKDGIGGKFILDMRMEWTIRKLRVINSHKMEGATERFAVSLGMEEDFSDLTEVFTWTLEDPRQMEGPLPVHDFPINRTEARFVQFEILSSFGNQGGLMYFAALEGRLTILYNFKL